MAARLTDRQKKRIIADRVQGRSLRGLATEYGVAPSTIKRVCEADPETERKANEKKDQNTKDILAYMEEKRDVVCQIIGKGLDVLNDPKKLAMANPAQITTALGTLIDKFTAYGSGAGASREDDPLSESLKKLAEEMNNDKR